MRICTEMHPTASAKIAKLLRLALIAGMDSEILAAVSALKRSLAAAGLDAHYVVDAFERGTSPSAPSISPDVGRNDGDGDDRSAVWFAFHRRYSLSPRDRQFIERLTEWRGPLSTKQRKWLGDILDKLAVAA
jgi:hypothetical protein